MSRENVEVVRRHTGLYDGQDIASVIRESGEGVDIGDSDAIAAAIAAAIAEDPVWEDLHPDVLWDATGIGFAAVARGVEEVAAYWYDWAGLWESYVYRVVEYRDLGDWVMTVSDVHARGRSGIDVEMRSFQAWGVRSGKIATMRACTSEGEALAAIDTARLEE